MTRQKVFWLLMTNVFALVGTSYVVSSQQQPVQAIAPGYGAIEGRVLDEKGHPVSGAKVSSMILDYPPGRLFSAETDAQGHFSLRYARPGRNAVYVGKEDEYYPDTFLSPFVDAKLVPVVNVVEQSVTEGVEVRLPPRGGKVVAEVIDASTQQPVAGARVTLCRADNPDRCQTINDSSPTGHFSQLIPSMPVTIKVSAPGFEDWWYTESGSTKTSKFLVPPGAVKGISILLRPNKRN